MKLDIVPTSIKFSYNISALESLLRQTEDTIKKNPKVCAAVLAATNRKVSETMKGRYPPDVSKETLLKALTPGEEPAVAPMHQMYLAAGADPDWVMKYSGGGPPQIMVLAEIIMLWQKKQTNVFLTRQLISILSMGLVNYLLDNTQLLITGTEDVMFDLPGIPAHLQKFAHEAFGSLGWSKYQYLPVRAYFDAAGYSIPTPNAAATHP